MTSTGFVSNLRAARSGDRSAQDALCSEYYTAVQRMAHSALRARGHTNLRPLAALFSTGDVVQDVFRGVVRNLGGFHGDSEAEFVAYLSRAVQSRLIDLIRFHAARRRDYRRSARFDSSVGEPRDATRDVGAEGEVRDNLARALESMPVRSRVVLVRRLEGGASFSDLAIELELPSAEAARKVFTRAKAKLALELNKRGIGPVEGEA
ncbi:MAG: sigma-70 family RNA polymerase sigma factor [Planctomycetota bacterium]